MPDEYISREAMLEHLDLCKQSEDATTLTAAVITALQCFVQSQPTADVVPVVRCKDCKYGDYDSKPDGAMVCLRTNDGFWRKETDFCSYGERKEKSDE